MNTRQTEARDRFLANWRSAVRPFRLDYLGPKYRERARQNFEAALDALLEVVRAEEHEAILSDGDAMREALKGSRW